MSISTTTGTLWESQALGKHHARGKLRAFAEHGRVGSVMPRDGGECELMLSSFTKAGVDLTELAADLQSESARSFDDSWQDALTSIDTKSKALK